MTVVGFDTSAGVALDIGLISTEPAGAFSDLSDCAGLVGERGRPIATGAQCGLILGAQRVFDVPRRN